MLKPSALLCLLTLTNLSLASSVPLPVMTLDYFVRLANRKGVCKDIKTIFLRNGDVQLIIDNHQINEIFTSSDTTSQCDQRIGKMGEEFILCQGSIQANRNGIPTDHREMPSYCSMNSVEIVNDTNELKNSIMVSKKSWEAWYGMNCDEAFSESERLGKTVIQNLTGCEF